MPTPTQTELDAILHGAAIAPLNDRAFLRITGADATRWLNGMVTNSIQALAPGEGNYNLLLNAQGRIQGDCTIYRDPADPPAFLLAAHSSQLEAVRQHLDHFIIMDDVELTPLTLTGLAIIGRAAGRFAFELWDRENARVIPEPGSKGEMRRSAYRDGQQIFLYPPIGDFLKPPIARVEIWSPDPQETLATERVLIDNGASEVSAETLEALRLLEGRPLFGRDITEKYLPQEINQPHALHFAKGCYLGQEIVERIRSRGQVHRLLTPLTLTGSLPTELPTPIEADGKPVGEITSAALVPLPDGPQLLALGYVRREALDTHAALTYSDGAAAQRSTNHPYKSPQKTIA